jgi:hypothetical protein
MPGRRCYITRMAAEITEITDSNQDTAVMLDHILTDLHSALEMLRDQGKLLANHDALLTQYRPLLERFAHPLAAGLTRRNRRTT